MSVCLWVREFVGTFSKCSDLLEVKTKTFSTVPLSTRYMQGRRQRGVGGGVTHDLLTPGYMLEVERSKVKVEESKMPKSLFCRNFAVYGSIYFKCRPRCSNSWAVCLLGIRHSLCTYSPGLSLCRTIPLLFYMV